MKTRSAKAKSKIGRPPREGVPRRSGNRIDYKAMESAEKARSTVVEARCRQHGIATSEADKPEWGYALGRLYLRGELGNDASSLLEAGNRMHADFERYYAVTGMPSPSPRAMDMNRVRGLNGKDRQDEARKASNRVMGIEGALALVDGQGRPVMQLTKRLIIKDEDPRDWTPDMLKKVRKGLTQLVDFYGIGETAKT